MKIGPILPFWELGVKFWYGQKLTVFLKIWNNKLKTDRKTIHIRNLLIKIRRLSYICPMFSYFTAVNWLETWFFGSIKILCWYPRGQFGISSQDKVWGWCSAVKYKNIGHIYLKRRILIRRLQICMVLVIVFVTIISLMANKMI